MTATPHYIKANHSVRVPRRHIAIDTESTHETQGASDVQRWQLGHAIFAEHTPAGVWRRKSVAYDYPEALWRDIAAYTRKRRRTVVWAHNLAYDIRISRGLQCMAMLGWKLADIRLSGQGTWVRWVDGERTLLAVDSFSVWPVKLETLGATIGLPKMVYPQNGGTDVLAAYCQRDTEILATAVENYITWIREQDVGNWQLTGAGQAWANWRHRHLTHNVLIGDTMGAREAERRAMWTGRAEAYSIGTDRSQTVYDWDWRNSYARICRDNTVPVGQHSIASAIPLDHILRNCGRYAVLAEVSVRTEHPVVPVEHEGRIIWPVGNYRTTLWDPELSLLQECGASVDVGRVYLYNRAPALKAWAQTVIGDLHRDDDDVPAWQKIVLKHWSRALIGRFAMRYRTWEDFATPPEFDLTTFKGHNWETGVPTEFLQIGHDMRKLAGWEDPADSAPFVTGYVMSVARARLWRVGQAIGWEHVLYVDTDSLLVDGEGNKRLQDMEGSALTDGLRLKGRYTGWSIAGPRQLVLGGEVRISGVPRKARRTGEWTFEGEVWRGLRDSILGGEGDAVRVTSRTYHIRGRDNRRERGEDGRTRPIRLPRPAGATADYCDHGG